MSSASNFESPLSDPSISPEELRQRAIDRLVDGELPADDERALLLQLEDQPHGWRACALAFLEARNWGGAARAFLIETTPAVRASTAATPIANEANAAIAASTPPLSRQARTFAAPWLTLATGLLIAFVGGAILRDYWPQVAGSRPVVVPQQIAKVDPPPASLVPPQVATPKHPVNLRLTPFDREGQSSAAPIDVPLVELPAELQDRAGELQNVSQWNVPPELIKSLEKQGQTVRQQTYFVTLNLEDGRTALIPMQRLQIVPLAMVAQ